MRFTTEQRFPAAPDRVAAAYADPELYASLHGLSKLTGPEVLEHHVEGDLVTLHIRYRFGGHLSSAAQAVLDPSRLTWVEQSVHDLARRTTTFTLVPDHYGDRFSCRGSYRFEPDGDGTIRHGEGDLRVRALLVGKAVEGAIVSGLREHLAEEVPLVVAYLSGDEPSASA
ncbi:MAG TPA: DUF2505 family protein [Acidimicrobiales bacterium]|nr:DUF2505 family protein [Acidimicrobiales bacterium]